MNDRWVDSTLTTMSLDEKIGQLFMVQAYSERAGEYTTSVLSDIQKYKVGGVIFMEGDPTAQATMTNRFSERIENSECWLRWMPNGDLASGSNQR